MDTKELKIINAAQALFLRHGFKKVSMSDIAEAAEVSRPTVYAVFANKEEIVSGLLRLHINLNENETEKQLHTKKSLRSKLECLFSIWIIEPFASAIDTESGKEMMATIGEYAPVAFIEVYEKFEAHVVEVLKSHSKKKQEMSVKDIARILSMATKGLKASTKSVEELNRLVDGLITMTLKMVED